jgi:hypothetical protein
MTPAIIEPVYKSNTFGAKDGGELPAMNLQGDVLEETPAPTEPIYKIQYLWSQGRR